jgi:mannose-1-phosphate guanylyltransferase
MGWMTCGFLPDGVRAVLGDGSAYGVRIRYIVEPQPLGTGGALKFAEELLEERFFMLNGDVLTDLDLTAQLAQHEATGARATLALYGVDDPSAYGLVRRNADLSVRQFVEKPNLDEIDTHLINAGAYILERSVLEVMAPAGSRISIERDVFPRLVGDGLFGWEGLGYWMDIGTPHRYLQAVYDILDGEVKTEVGASVASAGGVLSPDGPGAWAGSVHAPAIVGRGCEIAADATIAGRTVLGDNVVIGPGAHVDSSVVMDGARIGAFSRISRSVVGPGAVIGARCRLVELAMLGENARLGEGNVLTSGVRIFPDVHLPDHAITF